MLAVICATMAPAGVGASSKANPIHCPSIMMGGGATAPSKHGRPTYDRLYTTIPTKVR